MIQLYVYSDQLGDFTPIWQIMPIEEAAAWFDILTSNFGSENVKWENLG